MYFCIPLARTPSIMLHKQQYIFLTKSFYKRHFKLPPRSTW